jgi:hypothetical protein
MNAVVGLTFVENVDESQRGRVLGAQNAILTLAPALGIGGGAVLIDTGSLHVATTVFAAVWVLVSVGSLFNPLIRRLGEPSRVRVRSSAEPAC